MHVHYADHAACLNTATAKESSPFAFVSLLCLHFCTTCSHSSFVWPQWNATHPIHWLTESNQRNLMPSFNVLNLSLCRVRCSASASRASQGLQICMQASRCRSVLSLLLIGVLPASRTAILCPPALPKVLRAPQVEGLNKLEWL